MAQPVHHLIVARHEEDLDWLDGAKDWKVRVVQKDVDVPNEGREASSYFWAFQRLYRTLRARDVVACVQGNPFPHARDLWVELARPLEEDFRAIGHWSLECDREGAPEHPGLPLEDRARRWCERECPDSLPFVAGGQFLVSGRAIKRRPRARYAELQAEMSEGENPWTMERLWGLFFTQGV